MSGIKDHYSCKECGVIDEEVPANGGFCFTCGCHHGWTFLAENSSEMVRHEPDHPCSYDGAPIHIRFVAHALVFTNEGMFMDFEITLTDRDSFYIQTDFTFKVRPGGE